MTGAQKALAIEALYIAIFYTRSLAEHPGEVWRRASHLEKANEFEAVLRALEEVSR